MERKSVFIGALVLSFGIGGCASASMDTEAPLEIYDQSSGISANMDQDIKEDDGRHVSEVFTTDDPNYFLKIETDIHIPEEPIVAGTLAEKSVDISLLEEYLCGGENLFEKRNDPKSHKPELSYITENGLNTADPADTIEFMEFGQNSGAAQYSNYRLDPLLSENGIYIINREDWTDANKHFTEEMQKECQALFDHLDLDGHTYSVLFETGNAYESCLIYVNSMLQGLPMVMNNAYIQSTVRMGEPGVNSIAFNGLYGAAVSETVAVLTVDQILEIVAQGVKNKRINTYTEALTMELVYQLQLQGDEIHFYPVWCFCQMTEGLQAPLVRLSINAQNGDIEFMN